MMLVILLFPAIAAYGGFFDEVGKQLKEEASKLIKDKTQSTDSTTKKETQSTDNTTSKKSEDNSNTSPAKTNDANITNKPDSKQTTKTQPSDGAAAFKQLPEEIQNKIIDEATKAHRDCSTGSVVRIYYNCDCVKEKFIQARTTQGPDASYHTINRETRNRCISPESITEYRYDLCVDQESQRIKKYDSYCKCYSETMANKFVERPYLSLDFLGILHKESYKECGYNNYVIGRDAK